LHSSSLGRRRRVLEFLAGRVDHVDPLAAAKSRCRIAKLLEALLLVVGGERGISDDCYSVRDFLVS
jgi:hypothetical protein